MVTGIRTYTFGTFGVLDLVDDGVLDLANDFGAVPREQWARDQWANVPELITHPSHLGSCQGALSQEELLHFDVAKLHCTLCTQPDEISQNHQILGVSCRACTRCTHCAL